MKTIIEQATIVTMDDARSIFQGYVRVEGARITGLQAEPFAESADRRIDARGQVLLPGLINCHTHAAMSLLRNYGNDVNLQTWLSEYIWPVEEQLDAHAIGVGTRLNIIEMLRSGTTTFVDMYYEMDTVAQVVEEMGIRAVLTRGMTAPVEGKRISEQRALYRQWHGQAQDRIRVMIGPHAIYTNTLESLQQQAELGRELGCGFHIHLNETRQEVEDCLAQYGKRPVEVFDALGMLDERTIGAHCIWLDEKEREILAARKVNCCYNPASNLKLASGFMPAQQLLDQGINVCVGTDGASSNNRQDLLLDLHIGSLAAKGATGDPLSLRARTMLEMATRNGARAIGQAEDLGSIEVGKKADLILVDFRNAHHTPWNDVEAALVYSTTGADVSLTMVDGRILYEEGKVQGVDETAVREEAQHIWAQLETRGGKV